MGMVDIQINGRHHQVQCGDGEETRVRRLAAYIDGCAGKLAQQHGQLSDAKVLLRDKEGRVVGTFGLSRDITELKQAEAAVDKRTAELRASLARYKMLVESTHAVPWEMDGGTWAISYISPQAARVFGWDPDALLGKGASILDVVYEDDREHVRKQLEALIHSPEAQDLALDYRVYAAEERLGYVRSVMSVHREQPGRPGIVRGVTSPNRRSISGWTSRGMPGGR